MFLGQLDLISGVGVDATYGRVSLLLSKFLAANSLPHVSFVKTLAWMLKKRSKAFNLLTFDNIDIKLAFTRMFSTTSSATNQEDEPEYMENHGANTP